MCEHYKYEEINLKVILSKYRTTIIFMWYDQANQFDARHIFVVVVVALLWIPQESHPNHSHGYKIWLFWKILRKQKKNDRFQSSKMSFHHLTWFDWLYHTLQGTSVEHTQNKSFFPSLIFIIFFIPSLIFLQVLDFHLQSELCDPHFLTSNLQCIQYIAILIWWTLNIWD